VKRWKLRVLRQRDFIGGIDLAVCQFKIPDHSVQRENVGLESDTFDHVNNLGHHDEVVVPSIASA
jgi:hypothetical protein